MRIVLTGATGFVGGATLARLLHDGRVTTVTALSRRPPGVEHPKLAVHLQDDFGTWDAGLLAGLAEHDACVWAHGAKASDVGDPERYRRVTHDQTLALATGLAERNRGHLRFCYLSGTGADPRDDLRLPWERQTRVVKGRTERDLRALAARSRGFHVTCLRPGGVLPTTARPVTRLVTRPIALTVDEVAEALVAVAVGAAAGLPDVLRHRDVRRLARARDAAER
jgi:nucleoside-diphosphate-sugar epimerase